MAGVLLALTPLPLSAGWLEESDLSFIDALKAADVAPSFPSNLDLSVVRDGTESALRVPLGPAEDARDTARFARFMPYPLGGGQPVHSRIRPRCGESAVTRTRGIRARAWRWAPGSRGSSSSAWSSFGEYRFLHVNPDPAESAGAGMFRRDLDGPTLRGGINIRLP